jgi:putative ubiquitin-RnfH superfamily antitoxin RatB of RatAB toxin-antitoxin module
MSETRKTNRDAEEAAMTKAEIWNEVTKDLTAAEYGIVAARARKAARLRREERERIEAQNPGLVDPFALILGDI